MKEPPPPGPLVLAIPSKGELHDGTLKFLEACQLRVKGGGLGREYLARLANLDGVSVLFLRADEIPRRLKAGGVHLGITGEDLYREHSDGDRSSHVLLRDLGYGGARLVAAVPRSWVDVRSVLDLEEVALLRRQRRGGGVLRVATKFPRLTRAFFAEHGITDYTIVQSLGATEGAPASGAADIVVDITSSGTTLAQNHLKEVVGGTLLSSQACMLVSTRHEDWNEHTLATLEHLVELAEARLRARSAHLARCWVPPSKFAGLAIELQNRLHCGLSPASRATLEAREAHREAREAHRGAPHLVELAVRCPNDRLHAVVQLLRSAGCEDVWVTRPEFVFDSASSAMNGFKHLLRRTRDGNPKSDGGMA